MIQIIENNKANIVIPIKLTELPYFQIGIISFLRKAAPERSHVEEISYSDLATLCDVLQESLLDEQDLQGLLDAKKQAESHVNPTLEERIREARELHNIKLENEKNLQLLKDANEREKHLYLTISQQEEELNQLKARQASPGKRITTREPQPARH